MQEAVRMFERVVVEEEFSWPVTPEAVAAVANRLIVAVHHADPRGVVKEVRIADEGSAISARVDGGKLKLRLVLEVREVR